MSASTTENNKTKLVKLTILFKFAVYKLREKDRHVNLYAIVEEHYERYLEQEEEYTSAERIASRDIRYR